jgi:hypothetical protein
VQFIDEPTQKALTQIAERMRKTCDAVAHCLNVSPYVKKQRAHDAYCSARKETRNARVCLTYREQLRDLFAVFVIAKENTPPLLARCSVLSLCSASNAPSVTRVATTSQVPRE